MRRSLKRPLAAVCVVVGLLVPLCIPPPWSPAEFPLNVQLVSIGLLFAFRIPPP